MNDFYVDCPHCVALRRELADLIRRLSNGPLSLKGKVCGSEKPDWWGHIPLASLSLRCQTCEDNLIVLTEEGLKLKKLLAIASNAVAAEIPF